MLTRSSLVNVFSNRTNVHPSVDASNVSDASSARAVDVTKIDLNFTFSVNAAFIQHSKIAVSPGFTFTNVVAGTVMTVEAFKIRTTSF